MSHITNVDIPRFNKYSVIKQNETNERCNSKMRQKTIQEKKIFILTVQIYLKHWLEKR